MARTSHCGVLAVGFEGPRYGFAGWGHSRTVAAEAGRLGRKFSTPSCAPIRADGSRLVERGRGTLLGRGANRALAGGPGQDGKQASHPIVAVNGIPLATTVTGGNHRDVIRLPREPRSRRSGLRPPAPAPAAPRTPQCTGAGRTEDVASSEDAVRSGRGALTAMRENSAERTRKPTAHQYAVLNPCTSASLVVALPCPWARR